MVNSSLIREGAWYSIIPVLLLILFFFVNRKNQRNNRLLSLAAWLCLGTVVLELAEVLIEASHKASLLPLCLIVHSVMQVVFASVFPLYLLFLLRVTGRQAAAEKYRLAVWAPVAVTAVLLVINGFTGFMFTVNQYLLTPEKGPWYYLLFLTPAILGLISLPLMWRVNWVLAASAVILTGMRFTLLYSQSYVDVSVILMILQLILTVISLRQHSILFEIGTHLILLAACLLLLTGGYITNSTVASNLLSARNEAVMNTRDFISKLGSYKCLPWLLDFWTAHPEEMLNPQEGDYRAYQTGNESYGSYTAVINDLIMTCPKEFSTYTQEDINSLSPLFRYSYARSVYEYVKFNATNIEEKTGVSSLTLLRPDGKDYIFIADGEPAEASFLKPGEQIYAGIMEEEWNNFNNATANSGLRFGRFAYNADDRFGFYQEHVFGNGANDRILFCHSIPKTYVDTAVRNVSGFRNQLVMIVALLMIFILFMLSRTAVRPLRKIDRSIKGYIQDKDAEKVRTAMTEVRSRDEIGYLAGEFSDLTHEIEVHIAEVSRLAGERERLNAELSLAANIQQSALSVDFPDSPQFSLCASMKAAKVVGGDFYDFFHIDDDHLALVIADVSGKGVPAALFMMSAKIMINDRAEAGGTPAEILGAVNAKLCRNNTSNMFVTVWMGILELSTGILTHANAGHEYPMVREPDGQFHTYRDKHGMVLGGIDIARYRNYTLTLTPGDAIFVYTDGIPEANNPAQEFYDINRLEKALNSTSRGATPKEILEAVDRDVTEFVDGAEQFDDMTMLCLVYHGP